MDVALKDLEDRVPLNLPEKEFLSIPQALIEKLLLLLYKN